MLRLSVNGQVVDFDGKTVADLVCQQKCVAPFAVAVNTEFVAKNQYESTVLNENDQVDIVRPVVGG